MVGLGLMMLAVGVTSLFLRYKKRLYTVRWMLRCSVVMAPAGFVAMISGWVVTEVGRQPFTVYGLLRTAESASSVSRQQVVASTFSILGCYVVVFGIGLWVLARILRKPAIEGEPEPQPTLAQEIGKS
jgi:cytochrome d ubiquinol oxidase subunit I